jgi:6-pyruvoyltetrahydropterin/6-carboxytetrahydropterin synthase
MMKLFHRDRRGGIALEDRPTFGQDGLDAAPAPTLLLVTQDGGDGGALGRIVASATTGVVLYRTAEAVTEADLADADLAATLLTPDAARSFRARLVDRHQIPVLVVPRGLPPARLASALARTGDLPQALLALERSGTALRHSLGVETFFQASHAVRLIEAFGPAHTHSWHVRVRFVPDTALPGQVLVDFADARALLKVETDRLEGRHLNDLPPFGRPECQPTVENVVVVLFDRLDAAADRLGLRVEEVTLWENPTSYATCERAG